MALPPSCAAANTKGYTSNGVFYGETRLGYIPTDVSPSVTAVTLAYIDATAVSSGLTVPWGSSYSVRTRSATFPSGANSGDPALEVYLFWEITLADVSDQTATYQFDYTMNAQSSSFCIFMPSGTGALAGNTVFIVHNSTYDIYTMNTDGTGLALFDDTLGGPINMVHWSNADQTLYINDNGYVKSKASSTSAVLNVHNFGTGFGNGLAYHPTFGGDGAVWAGGTGGLKHWDRGTDTETTLQSSTTVTTMHDAPVTGVLWWYFFNGSASKVYTSDDEVVAAPVEQFTTAKGFNKIFYDAVSGNNYLYVCNSSDSKVQRMDNDGTNITDLITTYTNPYGIDVDQDLAKMFYASSSLTKTSKADLDGSNAADIDTTYNVRHLCLGHVNA